MTLAALINSAAAQLVTLAERYAAQNGQPCDLVLDRVEISRWAITIHMRPRPAVVEQRKK